MAPHQKTPSGIPSVCWILFEQGQGPVRFIKQPGFTGEDTETMELGCGTVEI